MSDDWEVPCSDDEKYELKKSNNDKWELPPEEILKLYEELDKGPGYFELNWKCPGRRPPTPEKTEEQNEGDIKDAGEEKEDEKDYSFDFEVEKGQLRLRTGEIGPRMSAKRKTTSLDTIISNMERYRRMDMMEEDPPEMQ